MPGPVHAVLSSRAAELLARLVLTFPFWASGLAKLIDFQGGMAEMRQFGLEPAALFNAAVLAVQLGGSALVVVDRAAWLGVGALGVFTALTIPIVHHFWSMSGEPAIHAFHTAAEHVGMVGALVLAAMLSTRPQPAGHGEIVMPTVVMARSTLAPRSRAGHHADLASLTQA